MTDTATGGRGPPVPPYDQVMDRWWKLQEPDDTTPVAVFHLAAGDVVRRYVPGEGLVDWPPATMWLFGDSAGAAPISEDEAVKLMRAGVGKLPAGLDTESSRGAAPTLPAPAGVGK